MDTRFRYQTATGPFQAVQTTHPDDAHRALRQELTPAAATHDNRRPRERHLEADSTPSLVGCSGELA
jgi:hypothetical protein